MGQVRGQQREGAHGVVVARTGTPRLQDVLMSYTGGVRRRRPTPSRS